MKNLNQKEKKQYHTVKNRFFLNAQFLPLRFPQNSTLREKRHLRNVAVGFLQKCMLVFECTAVNENSRSSGHTWALGNLYNSTLSDYSATDHLLLGSHDEGKPIN